jgi:hypothetical protein
MHHAALHVRPPGSKWLSEYPPEVPFVPARGGSVTESRAVDEWLTNYAPGRPAYALPPETAFLVKAGSDRSKGVGVPNIQRVKGGYSW